MAITIKAHWCKVHSCPNNWVDQSCTCTHALPMHVTSPTRIVDLLCCRPIPLPVYRTATAITYTRRAVTRLTKFGILSISSISFCPLQDQCVHVHIYILVLSYGRLSLLCSPILDWAHLLINEWSDFPSSGLHRNRHSWALFDIFLTQRIGVFYSFDSFMCKGRIFQVSLNNTLRKCVHWLNHFPC